MPTTQFPLKIFISLKQSAGGAGNRLVVAGSFIPLLMVFLYWLYKRLTRKTALIPLKSIWLSQTYPALDNYTKLREVSMLIRRVAISVAPRTERRV